MKCSALEEVAEEGKLDAHSPRRIFGKAVIAIAVGYTAASEEEVSPALDQGRKEIDES